ncbi:hypothetical protein PPYR_03190 [Photinus pyralis]|uniref:CRAL-TRIO domain-containing protein n=1 Tax=Photinus pyralis TaxID=7054 RepID=A0A5N4A237_PHOPY|nr:uncharacterized protein LOC116161797 [Photinus pyralis]KAB0791390.1 hypothetical protein PPYR_03190 [Photinus pyralis]
MSTIQLGFKAEDLIKANRTTEEDIAAIRGWQKSIRRPKLTDEQIGLFLVSCRNDREYTKKTIETYFEVKLGHQEIFGDRNIDNSDLKRMCEVLSVGVLPKRYEGSAILFVCLRDTNYRNYDMRLYAQLVTMTLEASLFHDPPETVTTVFDSKRYSFMHLVKLRLGVIKALTTFYQHAMPLQLGRTCVLNANFIAEAGLNLFKPFLNSEVLDKVEMYRAGASFDEFHK